MPEIRLMVSRHSAFYSPLIATIAGGFLEKEGLSGTYSVVPKGFRHAGGGRRRAGRRRAGGGGVIMGAAGPR